MSSAVFPSRGQCIQVTDNIQQCQCPWFVSTLLDQYICGQCGHGIHTHVDYVSMVVNHYPATQCVTYVQKTPLTQRCTCEVWLYDHVATDNLYCSAEPWNVVSNFPDPNGPSSNVNAIHFSNNALDGPHTPGSMSFSATDYDTVAFSHDVNLRPITAVPILSPSPRHAFSPSRDARNIPLTPTPISSPSASSASSGIQSDIAQTQAYGLNDYFVQYPDHLINSSYARQPDGDATNDGFYYHDDSDVMYGATPEA
ncbi:hypothetical protein DFS33DRAFT_1483432 [Desarmillaria ectypa]|nr:hypothetical protein DFS33DRAFT_1483432 [Desarmillaria ectypa]